MNKHLQNYQTFKFTKRKGGYGAGIISFKTSMFDQFHIGTKCDLVVIILKQLGRANGGTILLNHELNSWAINNVKEYNENKLAAKTLLEINYHRAIMSYLEFSGLSIVSDWEYIVEMLEFYWNNIKK